MLPKEFVYLDEAVEGIFWDAKYAGSDNFTGHPVDGYFAHRVVGTRALAEALRRAQAMAAPAGEALYLFDAYRPQRAVDDFVRWAAAPEDGRTRAAHYPRLEKTVLFEQGYIARRSGHSRGSTVDLTLADSAGNPIDMGGIFDLMDERSHPDSDLVTPQQRENRARLARLMQACGFAGIPSEWWHFRLIDEPYPDTFFDFPIE